MRSVSEISRASWPRRSHDPMPMRVTSIEPYLVTVPLRGAFKNAHAVKTVQKSVVVRVKTDAGLEGAGNVDPSPGYSEVTPETIFAAIESRLAPATLVVVAIVVPKTAMILVERLTGTMTGLFVPEAAPCHPINVHPLEAAAVTVTKVLLKYTPPEGLKVTFPPPGVELVRV